MKRMMIGELSGNPAAALKKGTPFLGAALGLSAAGRRPSVVTRCSGSRDRTGVF
jgi:hypothetical protein